MGLYTRHTPFKLSLSKSKYMWLYLQNIEGFSSSIYHPKLSYAERRNSGSAAISIKIKEEARAGPPMSF